jgi:hypothetical protein
MTRQRANAKSDFACSGSPALAHHGSAFGSAIVEWEVRSWRG